MTEQKIVNIVQAAGSNKKTVYVDGVELCTVAGPYSMICAGIIADSFAKDKLHMSPLEVQETYVEPFIKDENVAS